jgi:hypothetical protein
MSFALSGWPKFLRFVLRSAEILLEGSANLRMAMLLLVDMNRKTKTTMMIVAAALLCGIGNARALPLRILIEEQRAKIEPAIKKFQQECGGGRTDSQACKEERDALVEALGKFLSLVQNGFKVIDVHAGDASDADYQKQIEALRARAQQQLQWGREQLASLGQ